MSQNHNPQCGKTNCQTCANRQHNPLCSDENALQMIQSTRSVSRYRAGQTIFYQGNTPIGLFTVQSGLVKLESLARDGSAHTLRLMGSGQVFGHRALFASENYRASAIAVEDTNVCFVPKATIQSVVENNPKVGMNLLKQLSQDLRLAEEKWVTQVDREAPERVAEALIFLDEHFSNQSWTRREIAEWAGTTPETVMRTLSQFEKQGWIQAEGRAYKILNREKLIEKSHGT